MDFCKPGVINDTFFNLGTKFSLEKNFVHIQIAGWKRKYNKLFFSYEIIGYFKKLKGFGVFFQKNEERKRETERNIEHIPHSILPFFYSEKTQKSEGALFGSSFLEKFRTRSHERRAISTAVQRKLMCKNKRKKYDLNGYISIKTKALLLFELIFTYDHKVRERDSSKCHQSCFNKAGY